MKRYKALMSLLLAMSIFISPFAQTIALAETVLVEIDGQIVEQEVDAEGNPIVTQPEEEEQTEATQNISSIVQEPKLSGVDFVHIYDDSFSAISDYLRKFGIFKDTDTDEALVLTRGEFAILAARILNAKTGETQSAYRYEFKDVEETAEYYDAVNMLCNYGIVQGDGNGNFYPENEIKGAEAIIILMNMMGYYEIAHLRGEGDNGYRSLSIDMKFMKEVPFSYDTVVTLGQAARLIYHALHEKVADSYSYTNGSVTFAQSDETLMHRYMDILTIEGIVTANEFTSLSGVGGKTSENSIKINNTVLRFADDSLVPYEYLGLYARVYYTEDSGNNTAVFVEALSQHYELLKINAKNIASFDSSTMTLHYTENNKAKSEKIPISISIIFNSVAVGASLDNRYFTPDAGQIVFIDNDNDKNYDVLVIDSYSTYVAKGKLASEDATLYDDLSVQPGLCIADKNVKVYRDNVKADYTAIAAGDIVFAATEKVTYETTTAPSPIVTYQKLDTASENIRLLASSYVLGGNLEALSEDYLYIDAVEYEYAKSFYAAATVGNTNKAVVSNKIGVSVTGALDLNGDIVWMRRGTDENIKYGYLVKAAAGSSGFKPSCAKIYTQDDEMITVEFADKVKVHKLWEAGAPSSTNYYAKTQSGKSITADVSELATRQIIKYRLNSDGELAEIFFAADDTARDYLNEVPILQEGIMYYSALVNHTTGISGTLLYYFSFGNDGVIEPLFVYRKNTSVAFVVPSDESDAETFDDEKYYSAYSATSAGSPFTHAKPLTNVKLYDVDAAVVGAVVQEKKRVKATDNLGVDFDYDSNFVDVVVDKVRQVLDAESGDYVTELTGYNKGKLKQYKFNSADLLSRENAVNASLSKVSANNLKRGDVVMLHQDSLGAVDGFRVAHRPQYMLSNVTTLNPAVPYEYKFDGSARPANEKYHPFPTTSMFAAGKVVRMVNGAPFVDTGQGALRRMMMYGTSTVQVLIYDMYNDTITPALNSSKNPTFTLFEEGDYIYWYQYERYPMTVIAVRNYE